MSSSRPVSSRYDPHERRCVDGAFGHYGPVLNALHWRSVMLGSPKASEADTMLAKLLSDELVVMGAVRGFSYDPCLVWIGSWDQPLPQTNG